MSSHSNPTLCQDLGAGRQAGLSQPTCSSPFSVLCVVHTRIWHCVCFHPLETQAAALIPTRQANAIHVKTWCDFLENRNNIIIITTTLLLSLLLSLLALALLLLLLITIIVVLCSIVMPNPFFYRIVFYNDSIMKLWNYWDKSSGSNSKGLAVALGRSFHLWGTRNKEPLEDRQSLSAESRQSQQMLMGQASWSEGENKEGEISTQY